MESKLSNIQCFIISLLSISLLASSINGRELKEQSAPHSIKDDVAFQGDSSFISHSNPWANYWIYDSANNAKNEDKDLDKSKLEAIKSLINKEGMSFSGHLNPWANYWIYDNANNNKLNKDEIINVKNEEDLNESKIAALKNLLNKEDKSFVGHLNPWANYWIYDSANKKSTKEENNVKNEEELLKKEGKSFVGHLNPWANYWIYDNANKKSNKDEKNVIKIDEDDLNGLKIKALKELMKKEDKSFVSHSNPWANYWIYDSANKKSKKDENNVKKEDKSFVGHLNPWANYWIYDNANKKSTKDENNVKIDEEDLNGLKIKALKELIKKEEKSFVGHSNPWANYWVYDNANKKSSKDENNVKNQEDLRESKNDSFKNLEKEDNSNDSNVVLKQSA